MILPETLLFEDETGIKTIRPDKAVPADRVKGGSHNEVIELSDASNQLEEPYVTPFLLEKKRRKVAPPPQAGDTEPEHSEVEQQLREKARGKARPVKSSTYKVR